MNKSTESKISYGVLLALLAVFMPWNATSAGEFAPRATLGVAVAVVGWLLTRVGFMLFRRAQPATANERPDAVVSHGVSGGVWGLFELSCFAALTIGIGGITLGTAHIASPIVAFFITLVAQQVSFVILELIVALRQASRVSYVARAATVMAMAGLAVIFASASSITLAAQRPPVMPPFPDTVSVLFALPALLTAVGSLTYSWLQRSK